MDKIKQIILNPFILGLFIAVVISFFLNPYFQSYKIKLLEEFSHPYEKIFFHDIDHDGFDERICFSYNRNDINFPSVEFRKMETPNVNSTEKINQINLKKNWLCEPKPLFQNVDDDNIDEVLFLAYKGDSLFLLGITPFRTNKNSVIIEKYICKIPMQEETPDCTFSKLWFYDLNSDNHKEIIFSITGGWKSETRGILYFDLFNDTIVYKDYRYAAFEPIDVAIDKKHGPVICCMSYAPGNMKNPPPGYYSDSCSWMFIFDKNLNPIFPPVKDTRYKPHQLSLAFSKDSNISITAIFSGYNLYDSSYLKIFDLNGNVIAQRTFNGRKSIFKNPKEPEKIYFFSDEDYITRELNPDLSLGRSYKHIRRNSHSIDPDHDKNYELLSYIREKNKFAINSVDNLPTLLFQIPSVYERWHASDIKLKDSKVNLFIQIGQGNFYYQYYKNPIYYFKYPAYILIYLAISSFLFLLLREQRRRLTKKYETERRLNELEILTIKNQIDPHFTFNAINTISALQNETDKKLKHQFISDMSELIRTTLTNSRKIEITLKEEIDFVERYLRLQKIRYKNKFDINIKIGNDIDLNTVIPKMIIQTFAENEVKHGLSQKVGKGYLDITLTKKSEKLIIIISDNGIGREKAKIQSKHSTAKGYEIVDRIIEMYNNLMNTNVEYTVNDMFDDENNAAGTRVEIIVNEI